MNKVYLATNGVDYIAFEDEETRDEFLSILSEDVMSVLWKTLDINLYDDDAMQAYADLRNAYNGVPE